MTARARIYTHESEQRGASVRPCVQVTAGRDGRATVETGLTLLVSNTATYCTILHHTAPYCAWPCWLATMQLSCIFLHFFVFVFLFRKMFEIKIETKKYYHKRESAHTRKETRMHTTQRDVCAQDKIMRHLHRQPPTQKTTHLAYPSTARRGFCILYIGTRFFLVCLFNKTCLHGFASHVPSVHRSVQRNKPCSHHR